MKYLFDIAVMYAHLRKASGITLILKRGNKRISFASKETNLIEINIPAFSVCHFLHHFMNRIYKQDLAACQTCDLNCI